MAGKKELNRIKDVLKEKGRSQTWLASALDVDFVTISRYANNHRQPSIEVLFEIAKVLKVDVCELLKR